MRLATDYSVSAGPDPRGFALEMADGEVAGTIVDLWVDRAEMQLRYLEVEVGETVPKEGETSSEGRSRRRLVPLNVVLVDGEAKRARTSAIHSHQLVSVPTTRGDDSITLLEEERIQAFFAGGYLYADARRAEPLV
jgi:photosynthetic reaction center H subunit